MAHDHKHPADSRKTLLLALCITGGFAVIELVGGLLANSLALIGDAGHMATDALALGLGALAAAISRIGATARYSYGLRRAEVLGAFINVLFMFCVVVWIVIEAIERVQEPVTVAGPAVMVIAAIGLIINLVVFRILHAGEQTLNTRGALLHVLGDLLGSVAALGAGLIVWLTDWMLIDPLLSLLVCGLILLSSTRVLLDSVHVMMEGVPPELSLSDVGESMAGAHPDIMQIHDLHIWRLSSDMTALSAHVVLRESSRWPDVLNNLRTRLHTQYGISHITIQPEMADEQIVVPADDLPPLGRNE